MSIRFWAALWISKAYRAGIRMVGKDGSCTPGQLALKICPDFLKELKKPATIIAVTGTNGKTTTSNLVTHVLRDAGFSVTNNSTGSNVVGGVAAALLADTTLFNKPKNEIAVLEVDERSSLLVYKHITPDYLLCSNIMRDSMKRNAHTDFISYVLNSALPSSTHVILNADDFICSQLFPENKERTYFGLTCDEPAGSELKSRDAVYCPHCGGRLAASYVRWDHIGHIICPTCGMTNPKPDYVLEQADEETITVRHGEETVKVKNCTVNTINLYNCTAVVALCKELGISDEQLAASFEKLTIVKSRYDRQQYEDLTVTLQLAKGQNPAATARAYAFVASQPEDHKCILMINDDVFDNVRNCENTSWLYDTDNTGLADPSIDRIILGGPRSLDKELRAVLAGVAPEKFEIYFTPQEAADHVDLTQYKNIYILFDNYNDTEAQGICNRLISRYKKLKTEGGEQA